MSSHYNAQSDKRLLEVIVESIKEKKGLDLVSIDFTNTGSGVTNYFIICNGNTTTQVEAIANNVRDKSLEVLKEKPWKVGGYRNAQWILLDYVSIVVHVFLPEQREFYNLEGLWGDGEITKYDNE